LGEQAPDRGSVKLGTNLQIAVFDQGRTRLDPNLSLWEALTSDPTMAVSGRSDQIMVRGTPKHVVGYLKDFLFAEEQMRAPVRALSGGEKARLLLARLMAQESNLLILDEPTNDLDIETLDLLQDVLGDYDGTVLLVSHDRDFLDRVATTTIALELAARPPSMQVAGAIIRHKNPTSVVKKPISNRQNKARPAPRCQLLK
jgi:ATP-binding cassette subfamily F protein uup